MAQAVQVLARFLTCQVMAVAVAAALVNLRPLVQHD
jgi:hypothetical protein